MKKVLLVLVAFCLLQILSLNAAVQKDDPKLRSEIAQKAGPTLPLKASEVAQKEMPKIPLTPKEKRNKQLIDELSEEGIAKAITKVKKASNLEELKAAIEHLGNFLFIFLQVVHPKSLYEFDQKQIDETLGKWQELTK